MPLQNELKTTLHYRIPRNFAKIHRSQIPNLNKLISKINKFIKTCAATAYSSNNGSFVKCKIKGSSVDNETLSPRSKNFGNGFFAYSKNSLAANKNFIKSTIFTCY